MPWTESVEYLLGHGIDNMAAHNAALVSRLIDNVDKDRYEMLSPTDGPARTSIVVLKSREPGRTEQYQSGRSDCDPPSLCRGKGHHARYRMDILTLLAIPSGE